MIAIKRQAADQEQQKDETTTSTGAKSSGSNTLRRAALAMLGCGLFVAGQLSSEMWSSASVTTVRSGKARSVEIEAVDNIEIEAVRSCQITLDELDGIFDLRRKRRQETVAKSSTFDATTGIRKFTSGGFSSEKSYFDAYEPEANCVDEERFGSRHSERYKAFRDGPKFTCGIDRLIAKANKTTAVNETKPCLIYNVGSNNRIEFEKACSITFGKGCEIHTFDPTIPEDKYIGKNFSEYHSWGLGKAGNTMQLSWNGKNFTIHEHSLEETLKEFGHEGRKIDIFKIDCEGCEYTAIVEAFNLIAEGKLEIDQLQVEVHFKGSSPDVNIIKLFDAADKAKMRIFHKERNHWGCSGFKCVEYAFVSEDFLRKANSHYICNKMKESRRLLRGMEELKASDFLPQLTLDRE